MKEVRKMSSECIGETFGKLTILEASTTATKRKCKCRCECGSVCMIHWGNITLGKTTHCGCVELGRARDRHRKSRNPEFKKPYRAWVDMKERCRNPKNRNFKNYGGRGISVNQEWLLSFETFIRDMGMPPEGYSLERRDTNKNYCRENCLWVPLNMQRENMRRSVQVTWNGEKRAAKVACRQAQVSYASFRWKTKNQGRKAQEVFDELLNQKFLEEMEHF